MYTKENFLNDVIFELGIIKHLATKIPEGGLEYRPTPAQRSTLELLQFLSTSGIVMMTAVYEGEMNRHPENTEKYEARRATVTLENFTEIIDLEIAEMKEVFAKFTDADLEVPIDLFNVGFAMPKRLMLMSTVLKQIIMYKMQLFLYAKAAGNSSLKTMNLVMGKDEPVK